MQLLHSISTWAGAMGACDEEEEDDYIDMDISSTAFFCCSPQSKDFEFHKPSILNEGASISSPADELFYMGRLLPTHLPPRMELIRTLLQNPNCTSSVEEDLSSTELKYTVYSSVDTTPFQSCNTSSAFSCPVSRELNAEEYLISTSKQYYWSRRLKYLLNKSSLCVKLKSSRAYIKSLFAKDNFFKRNRLGQIPTVKQEVNTNGGSKIVTSVEEINGGHRRSFSDAIGWTLSAESSPSSSSNRRGASPSDGSKRVKQSNSANVEVENPIDGAIAHCKQSQKLL